MFGISPNKILFTVLIVAAVWYGFKWLGQYQAAQKKKSKGQTPSQPKSSKNAAQDADFEELVRCEDCGEFYVPSEPKNKGGHNCIQRGK